MTYLCRLSPVEMHDNPVHRTTNETRIPLLDYPHSTDENDRGDITHSSNGPFEYSSLHDKGRPFAVPNPEATSESTLLATREPAENTGSSITAEEDALTSTPTV